MKLLVVSRSEWSETNSTGNTLTSFLGAFGPQEIANLYFRSAPPKNDLCTEYFSLSEMGIFRGGGVHFHTALPVREVAQSPDADHSEPATQRRRGTKAVEQVLLRALRKTQSAAPLILQEVVWSVGWWRSKKLNAFLDEFSPDVIFAPSFEPPYVHKVIDYIAARTGAATAMFHADDYYFKHGAEGAGATSWYGERVRRAIRRTIESASVNFCISENMAVAYRAEFARDFEVLQKGVVVPPSSDQAGVDRRPAVSETRPIRLVYAGSLMYGRWKVLAHLAQQIKAMGAAGSAVKVDIFSQYPIDDEVRSAISVQGISEFHGALSKSELADVTNDADALLHVESFDDPDLLLTRYSFSTKIIDCLGGGRALIAIGPGEQAGIEYLIQSGAALVVSDRDKTIDLIRMIAADPSVLAAYAAKGQDYCRSRHDLSRVQQAVRDRLTAVASLAAAPQGERNGVAL